MTPAQTALYWREWSAVRRILARLGFASAAEIDAKRREIHATVLGADVSSKHLSNEQFDAVLAAFRAYTRPADLREQLRLAGAPSARRAALRETIEALAAARGIQAGDGRAAYLDTLCRRLSREPYASAREPALAKLLGVLQSRRKAVAV